jgi:beta-phosphoglucomutase-like phosphatase (HAD superfamily)
VVIEDSVPGIEAAVSAGMRGFGFTSSHDASDLASAGAAATFDTYDDLSRMLA